MAGRGEGRKDCSFFTKSCQSVKMIFELKLESEGVSPLLGEECCMWEEWPE